MAINAWERCNLQRILTIFTPLPSCHLSHQPKNNNNNNKNYVSYATTWQEQSTIKRSCFFLCSSPVTYSPSSLKSLSSTPPLSPPATWLNRINDHVLLEEQTYKWTTVSHGYIQKYKKKKFIKTAGQENNLSFGF